MRTNTLSDKAIRVITETTVMFQRGTAAGAGWLKPGVSGRQWLASLLIGLLLMPIFSLPITAATSNSGSAAATAGNFEPVNPPTYFWESAWTKLEVAAEEWKTARRAGNESAATKNRDEDGISNDKAGEAYQENGFPAGRNSRNGIQKPGVRIEDTGITDNEESISLNEVVADEKENSLPGVVPERISSDFGIAGIFKDASVITPKNGEARLTGEAGEAAKRQDSRTSDVGKLKGVSNDSPTPGTILKTIPVPSLSFNQPADRPVLNEGDVSELASPDNNLGSPMGQTERSAPNDAAALRIRERAGIGNFSFGLPVASLSGRGIDAAIGMSYNSQLWTKSNDYFIYNIDGNWLAPGFQMGYGYLDVYGPSNQIPTAFVVTDADGTRHLLDHVAGSGSGYTAFRYESNDGSFTKLEFGDCIAGCSSAEQSVINELRVTYSDGTKVFYTPPNAQNRRFPNKIMDVQGNYLTVAYLPNDELGKISTITDTLGRAITFQYDGSAEQRLIAVSVPGYNGSATPRQTIRFFYETLQLQTTGRFTGTTVAPDSVTVLKYVYFPGTKTGFLYDYSPYYGMIYKITQLAGIQLTGDGSAVVANSYAEPASTRYNYPGTDVEPPSPTMSEIPKYNKRTDDWIGRDTATAAPQTLYNLSENLTNGIGTRTTQITSPNGTTTVSVANVNPDQWDDGLIKETSVISSGRTLPWSKTIQTWDDGAITRGRRNPRIAKTETTNEAGQSQATTITYDDYNNPLIVRELDFAASGQEGSELRRTETSYQTDGTNNPWINNNLIHLPTTVKRIVNGVAVARTDYEYDNYQSQSLANTPGVVNHNATHDTYTAQTRTYRGSCKTTVTTPHGNSYCSEYNIITVRAYDPATDYRGNVTKATAYADATNDSDPNASVHTMSYDIDGNLISAGLDCCNLKTWVYDATNNAYAYPITVTKGSGPQLTTRATYDFNTGLTLTTKDENDQSTGYEYEANTLRRKKVIYPNGGYVQTEYSDRLETASSQTVPSYVRTTATLDANNLVQSYSYFDGRGANLRSATQIPGGQWSVAAIEYDGIGRSKKSYNPFYATTPTGAVPGGTAATEVTNYDALDRATVVKLQDNTTVTNFYNEAAVTYTADGLSRTGTSSRTTDQAGKERRQITDALGRAIRVDEPDTVTNGLGTLTAPTQPTHYYYDGNDNPVEVLQIDGTIRQERGFKYDSLSRLTNERQVEAIPTLDNSGVKGAPDPNKWTKVLKYDSHGLLTDGWDACGVKTHFTYDGLNRVKTVGYTNETGVITPTVTYTYDQTRANFYNNGALTRVETAASGETPATASEFDYDKMGRAVQHRQSIGTQTYNLAYGYNLAGQTTSETYPSGKVVTTGYDASGRMASIGDGGRTYLNNLQYQGLANSLSSMTLGNGTTQEFVLNPRLQMQEQALKRGTVVLQEYRYGYGQINSSNNLDTTKNNGQLAQIEGYIGTTKQFTQKFDYDAVGRLGETREYRGDNDTSTGLTYKQHFDYDRFGNQYHLAQNNPTAGQPPSVALAPIEAADIDKNTNRFTANTGTTYDEAGNVITDNKFRAMSFAYDANGRVVKATKANTPEAISVYDAAGRKIAERVNDIWKFSIYDMSGKVIADYGGVSSTDEGGIKYPFQDWQGSTRAITSNGGFVQSRTDYTAFGEEVGAGVGQRTAVQGFDMSSSLDQKYAQTERDAASGLDDTWARKLENKAGRWTSPDAYNGSAAIGDPQSFNRYAYVNNDPVNLIDPSGLNASSSWSCYITWASNADGSNFHFTSVSCQTFGGGGGNGVGASGSGSGNGGEGNPPPKNKKECNAAQYEKLTAEGKARLDALGVGKDLWNNSTNEEKLGFWNVLGSLKDAGISTAGLQVSSIAQDRTYFTAGNRETFRDLSSTVQNSNFSENIFIYREHPGIDVSYRQNNPTISLQIGFGKDGSTLEVDIDRFNPNLKGSDLRGLVGHFLELGENSRGEHRLTNPYKVANKQFWECL